MKLIAALFLLSATVSIALYWRGLSEPTPAATHATEPQVHTGPVHADLQKVTTVQRPPRNGGLSHLPASFAGTHLDGRLHADAAGNLVIDAGVRHLFDYFLASIGEESLETSIARLHRYIETQLPQPAEGHAIRLLSQYLDYKRQLLVLEQDHTRQPDLDAMRARLGAVQELRASLFDDTTRRAFFGLDEAADRFTLDRLAIRHNSSLNASEKGAALDRLRNNLPPELQDSLAAQLQIELREQTKALQASGGSLSDLKQLRQQLVGNAAAARLENLDARRQEWEARVMAYREEKTRIEASHGLGEADKRAAIARLSAERFDESERQRLDAAEQLLAATKR